MATVAMVTERYTTKNGVVKGYQISDMKGNTRQITPAELKNEVAGGNISLINFTLTSDDKLVYKPFKFNPNVKRNNCIILDADTDEHGVVNSYIVQSLENGTEHTVTKYELYHLISSGKLIPQNLGDIAIKEFEGIWIVREYTDGRVVEYVDTNYKVDYFKKCKSIKALEESLTSYMRCKAVKFKCFVTRYSVNIKTNDSDLKRIVCDNNFNGKELPDDKFWAIVEKNRSIIKEPITSVNAISIGAKLEYNLSNVIGPKMTDQQVCDLYASVTKYEMLAYNAACEGDKRFGQAIPYSDDRFREIVCSLIWLYGEKVYKEFLSDPVATVKKYSMPIERISHTYIFGY